MLEVLRRSVSKRDPRPVHTAGTTYDMVGSPVLLSAQRALQSCLSLPQLRRLRAGHGGLLLWYVKAGVFGGLGVQQEMREAPPAFWEKWAAGRFRASAAAEITVAG